MRVRKLTHSGWITPDIRPGDFWHFSELVEFMSCLPGDMTIHRTHGQRPPLLEYQIVGADEVPVFMLVFNLKQDRCWLVLKAKKLPGYFRLVDKRMINVPGRVYRTSENVYEIDTEVVQMNLMITQLANSMLRAAMGPERNVMMRTLGLQKSKKKERIAEFNEFVAGLEGVVIVKYSACDTPRKDRFVFRKDGNVGEVVQFAWLHPTAVDVMKKFAYCELDATFYCLKPYVLTIPQFVIKNCSYPIGIFFGTSESCDLYDLIHEAVDVFNENSQEKVDFAFKVLSDGGGALRAFCKKWKLQQFHCHRHLIEWFGTRSLMSVIMMKLLRSANLCEFIKNINLGNQVVGRLCQENKLTPNAMKKYIKFTGQKQRYSPSVLSGEELPKMVSRWALWVREYVTTCSNHAESFHRVLNHVVAKNGRKLGLLGCLREVKKAMEAKQKEWYATYKRNVKRQYKKGGGVCGDKESCTCWYSDQMTRRYQSSIRFPCPHLTSTVQQEQLRRFIEQGLQDLSQMKINATQMRVLRAYEVASNLDNKRDPQAPTSVPPETEHKDDDELADVSNDPIEEITRDIFCIVKPELSKTLNKPFAWVHAWTYHAITSANIDPLKDQARAYDAAWTAVQSRMARLKTP